MAYKGNRKERIKKLVLYGMFLTLLSPLIVFLLTHISVKMCSDDSDYNFEHFILVQTYDWGDGHYFVKKASYTTYVNNIYSNLFRGKNSDIVYIKNIYGNNFDKQLSNHIVIENEFLPENTYTVNAYIISGKLVKTDAAYNGSNVCDLYVDSWEITKEINRTGLSYVLCPEWYLTIFDFRVFDNILYDFIAIYFIALMLSKLECILFKRFCLNKIIKHIVIYVSSVIFSIALFMLTAYLYITIVAS